MNIPIFEQEIKDNLSELISHNSIAFDSLVSTKNKYEISLACANQKLILPEKAIASEDDWDLHWIYDVLVTVGWNNNDDIFDSVDTWSARNSPVNKQFNYMHNEKDIIGHIVASLPTDLNGKQISDTECPEQFELVNASVIYKKWSDPALQDRIDKIIAEIDNDQWFVSMECLFKHFDYGFLNEDGTSQVVARNQATAFLTKHLRMYGGQGEYNGRKLGRVLRNFTFSGKGLVNNPANPRSVIFNKVLAFVPEINLTTAETKMDNVDYKAELAQSQAKFEKLQAKFDEFVEAARKAEQDKLEKQLAALKVDLDDEKKAVADKVTLVEQNEKQIAEKDKELKAVQAKLVEAEKLLADANLAKVKANRLAKLTSAGLTQDIADKLVEKWVSASDEQFDDLVSVYSEMGKKDKKKEGDKGQEACAALDTTELEPDPSLSLDKGEAEKAESQKAVAEFIKWSLKQTGDDNVA